MKAYIARDLDGILCAFTNKPSKNIEWGIWYDELNFITLNDLDIDLGEFKDVKWTDDEPKQVEIKLL